MPVRMPVWVTTDQKVRASAIGLPTVGMRVEVWVSSLEPP
jgi:hypothetical protein